MNSFYNEEELQHIGFKKIGKDIKLSRKASIYNPETMEIGNNVRIDDFCILSGKIKIGSHIHIAAYCGLWGTEGICIDDFCGLSSRISIYTYSDDYSGLTLTNPCIPDKYKKLDKGGVYINRHVIIGTFSVILPGVEIGEGVAVGAMSLVKNSLKSWRIYAGIPAKELKKRKKDVLKLEREFLKEYQQVQR